MSKTFIDSLAFHCPTGGIVLEHIKLSAAEPKFWVKAYTHCIELIWTKLSTLSYIMINCKILSEMSYFLDPKVESLKAVS